MPCWWKFRDQGGVVRSGSRSDSRARRRPCGPTFDDQAAAAFRAFARDWLARTVKDEWRTYTERGLSEQGDSRSGQPGHGLAGSRLRCITWPERFGGRGLGPVEELIFYEEAALAGVPRNVSDRQAPGGTSAARLRNARPAAPLPGRDRRGDRTVVRGTLRAGRGFRPRGRDDDGDSGRGGYLVNGRKIWTSFAHYADRCFLLARTSLTERKRHNLGILLLDMRQPGVTVAPIRQITGMHEFNEVTFDDVRVEEADRLGPGERGLAGGGSRPARQSRSWPGPAPVHPPAAGA